MATKKNKHISDLTTADLKKKIAKKATKKKNIRIPVESLDKSLADKSFKIAKKDYDKFYKLGMKYAKEYNNTVINVRKGLNLNLDQSFGWTDGFVEGALQTLYDGMEERDWPRYY